jgi:hypothetical protein
LNYSNGTLIKQKKIKNEMVTHCNICKRDSQSSVGCRRIPKPQKDGKIDINPHKSPVSKSPSSTNTNTSVNFSFNSVKLHDRRTSSPGRLDGNYISLNGSNSVHNNINNNSSNNNNNNKINSKIYHSSNIDKLIKSNTESKNNEKRPIGSVSLAELERMSKKNKRRKSINVGIENEDKVKSTNIQWQCDNKPAVQPVSSSLGSLQGMLSNNVTFTPKF